MTSQFKTRFPRFDLGSSKRSNLVLFLLLFLIFIQTFLGSRLFSAAMDEQAHLPAGFAHLQSKEIEFRKSNAPFIGMLAALPSFLFSKPGIDLKDSTVVDNDFWNFGNKFLFSNDTDGLLLSGRLVIIFLTLLLGLYVFRWASDLFGEKAGLFSLFLFAFIPTVIGHAQLISTDVGLAVFFFISTYYFWKSLKEEKLEHKILSGLFLGLALASKFSGALLVPLFILLAFVKVRSSQDPIEDKGSTSSQKVRPWISKKVGPWFRSSYKPWSIILPVFIIGFIVLWAVYLFPSNLSFYTDGLRLTYAEDANPNYPVYLNGDFKEGGWWHYFLEGFIIKTPLPFLIFLGWALLLFKKYRASFLDKTFLLAPVVFFFIFTSWGAHNLGVRYLIPAYPFLAVYAGGIITRIGKKGGLFLTTRSLTTRSNLGSSKRFDLVVLISLSVWYIFSAVTAHPNQLAYFNELVGGSDNGYKYMDDSNIEWGQDLKRLKKFTDDNPQAKVVYIWRQGDRALDYYGIGKEKNIIDLKENWWVNPKGVYAVSSHFLVRAKLLSRTMNDPTLDWLSLYQPASRIGQSFFIYEF